MDDEELSKFQERLTKIDTHMQENFNLCLYDAIVRLRKPLELRREIVITGENYAILNIHIVLELIEVYDFFV